MKKKIIATAAITTCLALCAAVWPQAETVGETPIPSERPAVTAPQPTIPEPDEVVLTATTEKEMVEIPEAEPVPEVTSEEPTTPAPEIEKQAEAVQESIPPTQPEPIQAQSTQPEPEPTPEPEVSENSSEDMVYVEGFGWIESQGPNQVEYAEDMYENGNKIGSMG